MSHGRGQLHVELLASVKLLTELTTLAASLVIVTISVAEGLDGSAPSELLSASTEEVIALVWVGKSLLAELATVVASLWIVSTWDFRPLKFPLVIELVSPLTESCRLARSEQKAGLLLLQPASDTTTATAAKVSKTRARAPCRRGRDLPDVSLLLIAVPIRSPLARQESGSRIIRPTGIVRQLLPDAKPQHPPCHHPAEVKPAPVQSLTGGAGHASR